MTATKSSFTPRGRLVPALLSAFLFSPALAAPVQDKVPNLYTPLPLPDQHIASGLLADRMKVNLEQRLLKVDEHALLDGFTKRPGSHPWIGEHAGKFLHAAALTYQYTHDDRLKTLMDRVANTLIASQLPDGYLGTYTDDKRWTSWDVWSHKYNLIGLLAWYDLTHDQRALTACQKMGDILCTTFGDDAPGKKDLSDSGVQDGMAPTSVLEPMCDLYRHTGDKKYLDFCLYVTRNIEQHSKVISSLTAGKRVEQTSNAKAYEMLSNLVGLVELYRLTGDEKFLVPAKNAWESIVKDHLYVSGTTSAFEHFRAPNELPAGAPDNVGEGCVTVTWEQLNLSLLKLTADAKYADQLERTIYNALLAAQNAETGDICYFTPLVGPKPYTHNVCCCLSSEPRGIALIPLATSGIANDALVLNLYAPGKSTFTTKDGAHVTLTTETDFPRSGTVKLTLTSDLPTQLTLHCRQPAWCPDIDVTARQNGLPAASGSITHDWPTFHNAGSYIDIPRALTPAGGTVITLTLAVPVRLLPGGPSYPTNFAVQRGPEVLALDSSANPNLPIPTSATITDPASIQPDGNGFSFRGLCTIPDAAKRQLTTADTRLKLLTYADATKPIVWLPTKENLATGPLPVTFGGAESQSRPQKHQEWMPDQGGFTDLRVDTYRTTYNRRKVDQDWYAIDLKKPATISRIVFTQGLTSQEGGWFDTTAGKPEIQVKTASNPTWKTVATLDTYPATTPTDAKGVTPGQTFEAKLPAPMEITALRLVGKGSEGNNPKMNYTTCAELAAYAE